MPQDVIAANRRRNQYLLDRDTGRIVYAPRNWCDEAYFDDPDDGPCCNCWFGNARVLAYQRRSDGERLTTDAIASFAVVGLARMGEISEEEARRLDPDLFTLLDHVNGGRDKYMTLANHEQIAQRMADSGQAEAKAILDVIEEALDDPVLEDDEKAELIQRAADEFIGWAMCLKEAETKPHSATRLLVDDASQYDELGEEWCIASSNPGSPDFLICVKADPEAAKAVSRRIVAIWNASL